MRVIIAAENASTRFGGEAILPVHYFRLLRAHNIDVHLVVHARVRDELESLFPNDLERIHFIEDHLLQKFFFRLGKLLPNRLSEATFGLANQLLTQYAQRVSIRSLVTSRCVIHQPIPVSPRFPSLLYDLGAPTVMGPLNGGMDYPPAFRDRESFLSRIFIRFGRACSDVGSAIFPGKRRAAVLLVANQRTRAALTSHLRGRVLEIPENAVDSAKWPDPRPASPSTRFVFIGRLVDWKAVDIVIEALRQVPSASLDIIGDGQMMLAWRNLATRLVLADRVRFLGWRSQSECAQALAQCCALVLPSLYECGGAVVLEAMSCARPVIATAWGGPIDYLDDTTGILIEPASRNALVAGFAASMQRLIDSPEVAERMGLAGRARLLREFDWQQKIDRILSLYASILGESSTDRH